MVSRLKWCLLWIGGILICSAIGTGLGWVVVVVPKDYNGMQPLSWTHIKMGRFS